jgi:hypothetical protein
MKKIFLSLFLTATVLFLAGPRFAGAQTESLHNPTGLQFWRPYDARGVNVFEHPREDTTIFTGVKVRIGGAFAQQFQALNHENTATLVGGEVVNPLVAEIGPGFNLATANLHFDAQFADGVRMNLITYLSSRNHPETWVKGGYFWIERLPFMNSPFLDQLMEHVTLRIGHFGINYGDAHFRRTDNAHAMHNPFVGNYIMDAFTTEIGGEVYVRSGGLLAMAGVTGGEIRGNVRDPDNRKPSLLGKLGYDTMVNPATRLRLTGSVYHTAGSISNTLYGGDRAGSRYYDVMGGGNFSGRVNPGMRDRITAVQINPFVQFAGLELFGILERASGRAHNEAENRVWNQYAGEALYRFGPQNQFYLGGR